MESATDCQITAEFENRLGQGADAGELARSIADVWRAISEHLSPVLGARGVGSLYRRCLFVAAAQHAWLRDIAKLDAGFDPAALTELFRNRMPRDVAVAGTLLFTTLNELLASLVGSSLTERLLQPVWSDFLRATSTKGDTA